MRVWRSSGEIGAILFRSPSFILLSFRKFELRLKFADFVLSRGKGGHAASLKPYRYQSGFSFLKDAGDGFLQSIEIVKADFSCVASGYHLKITVHNTRTRLPNSSINSQRCHS
ncbi:MAG: hypothetical protein B6D68_02335 [spirochete symbiont of Stewartia floridana]|nr:MAG: hypothetical protein B6D68_02335 [spirochete symbiont of Stewartia floridana]